MQPMLLERPAARETTMQTASPAACTKVNFDAEVRRCQGQLFRIALSLTGSEADAWDAVQEALLRAYTHLPQYRGESAFSTWLVRILYRACYDELRRRGRRPLPWSWPTDGRGSSDDVAVGPLPGPTVAPGAPATRLAEDAAGWHGLPGAMTATSPDPADMAEQRDTQRRVRLAVGQLPPAFRSVVAMQLKGMSYLEIGEQLGLPAGTVKSRLHRARLMLRDALDGQTVRRPSAG